MDFIVLNVLKSSVDLTQPSCTQNAYVSDVEEVEMVINTANINFIEPTGKNTSRITFTNNTSINVLCSSEYLLEKLDIHLDNK